MNTLEILRGKRELLLRGDRVEVSEMSWLELKFFLERLSEHAESFTDDKGQFVFRLETIIGVIKDSQDLSERLLLKTVSRDGLLVLKDSLESLSAGEFLGLVDQALDLNLSVVSAALKKIGGRLKGLAGAQAAPLPMTPKLESSTSSSGKAGATPT